MLNKKHLACLLIGATYVSSSFAYARGTCSCSNSATDDRPFAEFCTENKPDCESDCYKINRNAWVGFVENTRKCPAEQTAPLACSGEQRSNNLGVNMTVGEGDKAGVRLCIEGPQGKSASKLYCSMYDDATKYIPCSWSMNTNGSCPYMASVGMKLSVSDDNRKTYCWVFNTEDVKRDRQFFLDADWE